MPTAFSPKTPDETVALSFDFSRLLAEGETIGFESVTCQPNTATVSSVTVDGPVVSFLLAGGDAGDIVEITCEIQTTLGQVLQDVETIRVVLKSLAT